MKISLARAGLGCNQRARCDGHHNFIDVGKLPPLGVDPVEVGIAFEQKTAARRGRAVAPWIEARNIRVLRSIHARLALMKRAPTAHALRFHQPLQRIRRHILGVVLLQVVSWCIDIEWTGSRESRKKRWIGFRPRIAHRKRIDDLDGGRLAIDQHLDRRTGKPQLAVVDHVLPEIPEVLRRERMAIRPAVPGAQMQREAPPLDDIDIGQDVRHEIEVLIVTNEARIVIDHDHAQVALVSDQRPDLTAMPARLASHFFQVDDPGIQGNAFGDGRQLTGFDLGEQRGRFNQFTRLGRSGNPADDDDGPNCCNHASGLRYVDHCCDLRFMRPTPRLGVL